MSDPESPGGQTSDGRVLGDVGTKLLFENDLVKIWELRLAPGESTAVHEHDYPHILVPISGDRIAGRAEPDSRGPHPDHVEAGVWPGAATYYEGGGIETAINVGEEEFLQVIVELKQRGAPDDEATGG